MSITLSAIYTYPVKSCGRLSHTQIELDARGPLYDRRWMIVDADGLFITARELPKMQLIQPGFRKTSLTLEAPDMETLRIPLERERGPARQVEVWGDRCDAWDEGNEAAAWVSDYLGVNARLVRMAEDFRRPVDPDYAPQEAHTGFNDGFPLLILSEASVEDLNCHLVERGKAQVPISRFRPNLVFRGSTAYAEDGWKTVQVGAVTLDVVKPCARCVMTTVDPATGTQPDPAEPLATLSTYRKQGSKVLFAQNAIHRTPGMLRVGDVVKTI
jgi:uncharacterized protein YcbX